MIGRIITASTTPAVKIVPPPASETLPSPNRKNQLRFVVEEPLDRLEPGGEHEDAPQPEDD